MCCIRFVFLVLVQIQDLQLWMCVRTSLFKHTRNYFTIFFIRKENLRCILEKLT